MKFKLKLYFLLILIIGLNFAEPEEKNINIKVVPARSNKLSIEDLDQVKMEILHDVCIYNLIFEYINITIQKFNSISNLDELPIKRP